MAKKEDTKDTGEDLEFRVLKEKINEFEDTFNPEHFYCRLREMEFNKRTATIYASRYKAFVYDDTIKHLKRKIVKKYIVEKDNGKEEYT